MRYRHNFEWPPHTLGNNILEFVVLSQLKEKPGKGHEITGAIKDRFLVFF
jgi:hypothetical protein